MNKILKCHLLLCLCINCENNSMLTLSRLTPSWCILYHTSKTHVLDFSSASGNCTLKTRYRDSSLQNSFPWITFLWRNRCEPCPVISWDKLQWIFIKMWWFAMCGWREALAQHDAPGEAPALRHWEAADPPQRQPDGAALAVSPLATSYFWAFLSVSYLEYLTSRPCEVWSSSRPPPSEQTACKQLAATWQTLRIYAAVSSASL